MKKLTAEQRDTILEWLWHQGYPASRMDLVRDFLNANTAEDEPGTLSDMFEDEITDWLREDK